MKRVLLLLVALATLSSAYALPLGEFPLAPRPTSFAPYDRRNLKLAANDTTTLAVWEDFRVDPTQPPRIWATRLRTETAEILDPTGIMVTPLTFTAGSALQAVATDGADFLIAWTDGEHLRFTRVLRDGSVVAAPDPNTLAQQVSISFIGDVYAVFSTSQASVRRLPTSVSLLLVAKNGTVEQRFLGALDSTGINGIASTVSSGNLFLDLAWSDIGDGSVHTASFLTSQLRAGRITPAPHVNPVSLLGNAPILLSTASNGTDIFVASVDVQTDPATYRVQRFDGNGNPLGPSVLVEPAPGVPEAPAVAWDGTSYVVVFKATDKSLQAVRFDSNGSRIDTPPLLLSPPNVGGVAVATTRGAVAPVVAWFVVQPNGAQISADFLTPQGRLQFAPANLTLSTSFVDRSDATVVWRGDHYLAAWRDTSNVTRALVGRITPDGQPLDGTGINLSSGGSAVPPVLASDGRTAVVAWLDFNGVAASFVDETGHVFRRMFDFPGGQPSVNWNGQQYVVMWRANDGQLMGLRLSATGSLIDNSPIAIAPVPGNPTVGWTGNSYVVAISEVLPPPVVPPVINLSAQFVSSSLGAIGTRIQIADFTMGAPVLADGPAGTLVVWTAPPRGGDLPATLQGARVVNGAVLDPFNGFFIGTARDVSVYGSAAGWGVVTGPTLRLVSRNGAVSAPFREFPFVPEGAHSSVALGGPAPLVIYRRDPVGAEQMKQVVGRFLITQPRQRPARH